MIIGRHNDEDFHISDDSRRRHLHIIGQTGTGKSALLANLIGQDLAAGNGIAVVDPHGELAEAVLALVPRSRFHQVVYINGGDLGRPVGYNPLYGIDGDRAAPATDEIVAAFKAVWAWSDQTAPRALYILRNTVRSALGQGTFLSVLESLAGRGRLHHADPVVNAFWRDFRGWDDRFRKEAIAPVVTRLNTLLASPAVRNILCQPSTIDLRRTMDEGRILICNLDKGQMGEENSHLLGAFLVSGIVQAAMNRSPQFHQRPFYLYADEFQNFATESFSTALSEARKKGLSMTIAHQYVKQVPEGLMSAVLGNTGTTIAFRVGAEDAELLASHIGDWVADKDLNPRFLKELPNYECVARVLSGGAPQAVRLRTVPPPAPLHNRVEQLVRNSRTRFGRSRALVEMSIARVLEPAMKKRKATKVRKW